MRLSCRPVTTTCTFRPPRPGHQVKFRVPDQGGIRVLHGHVLHAAVLVPGSGPGRGQRPGRAVNGHMHRMFCCCLPLQQRTVASVLLLPASSSLEMHLRCKAAVACLCSLCSGSTGPRQQLCTASAFRDSNHVQSRQTGPGAVTSHRLGLNSNLGPGGLDSAGPGPRLRPAREAPSGSRMARRRAAHLPCRADVCRV